MLSCSSPSAHPVPGLLLDPPLLADHFVLALLLVILLLVLEAPVFVAQEAVLSSLSPSAHPVLGLLLDPPLLAAHLVVARIGLDWRRF